MNNDTVPCGAIVILAEKLGHERVLRWNFLWRICVSYHFINGIIHMLRFSFCLCVDVVTIIRIVQYKITINLDSRYWKLKVSTVSLQKILF